MHFTLFENHYAHLFNMHAVHRWFFVEENFTFTIYEFSHSGGEQRKYQPVSVAYQRKEGSGGCLREMAVKNPLTSNKESKIFPWSKNFSGKIF